MTDPATTPTFTARVRQVGRWCWEFEAIEQPAGTWLKYVALTGHRYGRKRAIAASLRALNRLRHRARRASGRQWIELP